MKIILLIFLSLLLSMTGYRLQGNNILISNVTLTGKNTTDHYIMVQFDLSWENSWRNPTITLNRDAAWIFVKYRIRPQFGGDGLWKQASLHNSGHFEGTGTPAEMDPGLINPAETFHAANNPAIGVFINRSGDGTGTFSITGAKLRWNYGVNNVADGSIMEIRVFAVEMVYVPMGTFTAGSGGSEILAFNLTTINTADATAIPSGTGTLGGQCGGYPSGQTAPSSMSWPNGYNAFYCMKYEISQQQYVDFLNTLTYSQQCSRIGVIPSSAAGTYVFEDAHRSGIRINTPGVATAVPAVFETTLSDVACGYLKYQDGAAFADWAGIRPMTELEFEKAARGIASPVADEFPWGTTTLASGTYTLSNAGNPAERITTNYCDTAGNVLYGQTAGNIDGPVRVGIFAANAQNSGRITSGTSYWGIADLGGNVSEQTVTIGNETGRNFTGKHGDGNLNADGNANVPAWPGLASGAVTGTTGAGRRGGHYNSVADVVRTSERTLALTTPDQRLGFHGFRAARSKPFICGQSSLIINHIAGPVAAENKKVIYNTVTNIPGEASKCWISKNLGSDRQSLAKDDNSEASAGWYWKFNRKQGYKHNGTIASPAWTNQVINESCDWQMENDPCRIELGGVWRLPTKSEWENVRNTGVWFNWNSTWNSPLKLHAAGYIYGNNGTIEYRGTYGMYWSNTQSTAIKGWFLVAADVFVAVGDDVKTIGYPVRCLAANTPDIVTTAVSSITTTTAVSGGRIISDGNAEITERGVCWSTSTGPTIAQNTKTSNGTGSGTFTSNLANLSPGTTYYARAFATTPQETVYGNEVTFTTDVPFTCGSTITKNHSVSGGVAPVNKTVTYGTVTNIPGETSKCWITRNLGASQQASSVSDNTEASAGWYWQFNLKQGYKQDGSSRTPGTTWINSVPNWSNWASADDPCTLELGSTWRIPTNSEWVNIGMANEWYTWNGPWGSALKLHAAGFLTDTDGSLDSRGVEGRYYSSTTYSNWGYYLILNSGRCSTDYDPKAFAYPLRCIR